MLLRDSFGRSVEFHLFLPLVLISPKIGSTLVLSLVMLMELISLMTSIILLIMPMMPLMAAIPILRASLMLICV